MLTCGSLGGTIFSFGWDINPTNQFGAFLDLMACVSIIWKCIILRTHTFSERMLNAGS